MVRNKLNDLTGREWLFWTNTVYETSFPPDATHRLRKAHGAMKPPELMAEIIRFFTAKANWSWILLPGSAGPCSERR